MLMSAPTVTADWRKTLKKIFFQNEIFVNNILFVKSPIQVKGKDLVKVKEKTEKLLKYFKA